MSNGFSRSPKLLKGALIQFSAPMLIPVPNIIIFQYNPETMTRTLIPWSPAQHQRTYNADGTIREDTLSGQQLNQLSQPFDPQETFSLTLELDAADALEEPSSHPIAVVAGVADRVSAMEMLCSCGLVNRPCSGSARASTRGPPPPLGISSTVTSHPSCC